MSAVYFMRRADGVGPVKIGCSQRPAARLAVHQDWSPEPLTLIATAPGGFRDERRLHREFAAERLHAEWFEASPRVLALVARVCATGALPPPSLDDRVLVMGELYRSGQTLEQIGKRFGITRERVRQILRANGVVSLGFRPEVMRKVVTSAVESKIVEMGRAGHFARDIADHLCVCPQLVSRYLRNNGVPVLRRPREHTGKVVDLAHKVAADYRAGEKTSVIAERYGIFQPTIYRLIRIAGVPPRRRGRPKLALPDASELQARVDAGASINAIAKDLGVSSPTIKHRLFDHRAASRVAAA